MSKYLVDLSGVLWRAEHETGKGREVPRIELYLCLVAIAERLEEIAHQLVMARSPAESPIVTDDDGEIG